MANGRGWIDCIDCINCEWRQDKSQRYCNNYKLLLPTSEELQHQHTVCAKFISAPSKDLALNSEVVATNDGANYYIYRRSRPLHKTKEPIEMESNILYTFHYNEHILKPFMKLKHEGEI